MDQLELRMQLEWRRLQLAPPKSSRLESLNMTLSGTIPPQLGHLSFLVSLDLTSNLFVGALPPELSLLLHLKFMSLRLNNFTGDMPPLFGQLPKLEYLNLRNNSFTGSILKSLSNLTNIEIGSLTSLQRLYISGNNLNDTLPHEIGSLESLVDFGAESNQIGDSVDFNVFINMSSLQTLLLWRKKFIGNFSRDVGNLTILTSLPLHENYLTGFIPPELGRLY
ncbi:hypothetical protein AAHA92_03197 [Salvia divinorum]|uniref:Uncharacterized protein n=1 Tax=Salvia divinorum TaxID=28513 RepID=A0ABD1IGA8_SALDI